MAAKRTDSALPEVDLAHPQALTRRNMRDFDRAERQAEARKKGESTPVTKNSGREYRTSDSSPPPLSREVLHNVVRKQRTDAPGEQADIDMPLFQETSSEWDKACVKPESVKTRLEHHESRPSLGAKQKQTEEKAKRMKMTGLELMAEKEARRRKEAEEATKTHNGAHSPTRQEPVGRKQLPHARIRGERNPQGSPAHSRGPNVRQSPGRADLPKTQYTDVASLFPPEFPRFQSVQNVNDIGAYLANASYIVSVGGPPVSDLKYGIVLVPVGEEKLLFGKQPDNGVSQSLEDAAVLGAGEQIQSRPLHAVDEDSAHFRRPRFASPDHDTESAVSPAIHSPAQDRKDDLGATSNGRLDAGIQGLEHTVNRNAADLDGDTQMSEAGHSAQDESSKLVRNSETKGQEAAMTAPAKMRRGSSKQRITKPQGVVKKTAAGMGKAPPVSEHPTGIRNLRSRKPSAKLGN